MRAENETIAKYDRSDLIAYLQGRATEYHCGQYIYHLNGVERTQLYQELELERIERKYYRLKDQYRFLGNDWNEAMFVTMMGILSDKHNKKNYIELAYRVGYSTLIRERGSIENMEAILIAASGLMGQLPIDDFTKSIRERGEQLLRKYDIVPLSVKHWQSNGRPATRNPILRFAQMAQLIFRNDLLFNNVIECRTRDNILTLFNVPARREWLPYFTKAKSSKIGVDKCDLFGINVVVPILYTFGHESSSDELVDAANELNETIPAEANYYITGWRRQGLNPLVAYDAQALIQLGSEYCHVSDEEVKRRTAGEEILSRCDVCPLFRHLTSRVSAIDRVPLFLEGCEEIEPA